MNRTRLAALLAAVTAVVLTVGFASAPSGAGAAGEARGGTLRIDSRSDFDYVDPSLAYFAHSWQMLNAVSLKLLGYPDVDGPAGSRLRPEAATGFPVVSNDGRTYTFTIKPGFRFSNGRPVTAANFAYAINRALSPKMSSPAAAFVADVIGADAVRAGKAQSASGVVARGRTLKVTLKAVAPDFLSRLTMPFFAAMPTTTPLDPKGVGAPLVSAGPYYLEEWTPNRTALLVRNPYWKRNAEPYRSLARPANVDAIGYTFGNSLDATKLRIDRNDADLGSVPAGAVAGLVQEHGLNKSRFFIRKQMVVWYLAMNTQRGIFAGNADLRKAVNWAIDRPQLTRQLGYLAGGRTDQLLPPGIEGYKDWKLYPLEGVDKSSLAVAKKLAAGKTRDGKVAFYSFNSSHGPLVAQVVQYNLKQLGLDVDVKLWDRVVQEEKAGTKGEPFDLTYSAWGADYPDPSTFVNPLLDGTSIQAANNKNQAYFSDRKLNARIAAASRLSGDARAQAYGTIDRDAMRDSAPYAPFVNVNARLYVSSSVGCFSYSPAYGTTNLVGVCKR